MKKYRPSNGTEGMSFMEDFCFQCIHECPAPDVKPKCDIMTASMMYGVDEKEYPEEWIYNDNGKPTCTKFVKWDWGKDDDGNWVIPTPPPFDDPNQLVLPFIFDEIGVPKTESELLNT